MSDFNVNNVLFSMEIVTYLSAEQPWPSKKEIRKYFNDLITKKTRQKFVKMLDKPSPTFRTNVETPTEISVELINLLNVMNAVNARCSIYFIHPKLNNNKILSV